MNFATMTCGCGRQFQVDQDEIIKRLTMTGNQHSIDLRCTTCRTPQAAYRYELTVSRADPGDDQPVVLASDRKTIRAPNFEEAWPLLIVELEQSCVVIGKMAKTVEDDTTDNAGDGVDGRTS
jgi:hypothetical protein